MRCTEYTEKEIVIFNGLIGLIKDGANPYSIKVSDIAKAANIGKGTIYDYFDSKEEAISKALIFSINNELEMASTRIKSIESFKNMFYEVLNIISESMHNNLSTVNILLTSGGMYDFYEYMADVNPNIKRCMTVIDTLIAQILESGYKDGTIKRNENYYYQSSVVRGVIASFSGYFRIRELHPNVSEDEAKDCAYKMLIKALN